MEEPVTLKYIVYGVSEDDIVLEEHGYKYNSDENTYEKLISVTEKTIEADWLRGRCLGFMITAE